jgi:HEAT repeat protein
VKNVIGRLSVSALFAVMLALSVQAQVEVDPVIDSLFIIASSGEVMHQEAREPAMDSIATYGTTAVPFLIAKLDAISRQEKWTALWVLQRIGGPAVPFLVENLSSPDGEHVQRVCWALSTVGDSTAVEGLVKVMSHPRWQVREEALGALGHIKDHRADSVVLQSLGDSIGQVRKGGAVAAGVLLPPSGVKPLITLLSDDFYGARMSAFESLAEYDTASVNRVLTPILPQLKEYAANLACQLLGETKSSRGLMLLNNMTISPDPALRSYAELALIQADPEDKLGYQKILLDRETDRLNRIKLESTIKIVTDELRKDQE